MRLNSGERGRSAVEMAELQPPRWSVHPMRVIFMISRDPPPALSDRQCWSLAFHNFVTCCLVKVRIEQRTDTDIIFSVEIPPVSLHASLLGR